MARSVLITGCSSGFGLDASVALAQKGWQVFPTMRNLDKRERLDKALAGAGVADRATVLQLDVDDAASITAALDRAGRLDAVVNNAGISLGGAFEDVDEADVRRVMETNFFGVLALTRAVLPGMRAQRSGHIVVVSSNSAFDGAPGMSAYTASKWAVEGWAECLAYEVTKFGIHVVLVEPGSYATDIWDSSPRIMPADGPYAEMGAIVEPAVDKQVIRRARDPREVADVIVKALESSKPKLRWPVGPDARIGHATHGIMPFGVRKAIVERVLGLHRWKP
ncbi:MAG: short-chain dehydrogenase [Acidimicrobiales bacterium]|jgi:NAD(P)-dependent dehydrogenase (short-subunit alcohol dehydrogenase family)|nr:short-chain dehydrogenase [Acidimicrobiales bacterium]